MRSVRGLLLILIFVGSCIIAIIYKIRTQSNIITKGINIKYFRGNSEKEIDPDRVVACVDIDGPNEAVPALLGGSGMFDYFIHDGRKQ